MTAPQIIVAGHICLDIIPAFAPLPGGLEALLVPGKLIEVGAAVVATGGPVSNTGLALHRLGVPVALMGKVGDDLFGKAVLDVFNSYGPQLAGGMIVAPGEQTSYSVVINPPGVDRIFLHCPGANDTFSAADVAYDRLRVAKVFHFGYPPLMRRMYADDGRELAEIMRRVRSLGLTTSLDMAMPDPAAPAGRACWPSLLRRVLPHVDVFAPSLEEILFMLDRDRFTAISEGRSVADGRLLAEVSDCLLTMGAAVVALKLGDQGLYLRTTADRLRLRDAGPGIPDGDWVGREMLAPCFAVDVVGTTGSGDCTIAGLLAAMVAGLSPRDAVNAAVAVGACNVEAADAVGGIRPWKEVRQRIAAGWSRREVAILLPAWRRDEAKGLMIGPGDRNGT